MGAQGLNKGFHVLDEFVCEAIHAPSVPVPSHANKGRNPGMSVVKEFVFDVTPRTADESAASNGCRASSLDEPDARLESVIEPLATYVVGSNDPRGALADALELLFGKLFGVGLASELTESFRRAGLARAERTSEAPDPKQPGPAAEPDSAK